MKKLLVGLLALTSLSSFAFHPGDTELLSNIGVGTELIVLSDINVVPNKFHTRLGERCNMVVKETKKFDRVLSKDSVLKIIDIENTTNQHNAFLKVDNTNILHIFCWGPDSKKATIGDAKDSLDGIIEVKLADPTRI